MQQTEPALHRKPTLHWEPTPQVSLHRQLYDLLASRTAQQEDDIHELLQRCLTAQQFRELAVRSRAGLALADKVYRQFCREAAIQHNAGSPVLKPGPTTGLGALMMLSFSWSISEWGLEFWSTLIVGLLVELPPSDEAAFHEKGAE